MTALADLITGVLIQASGVGMVWVYAWICNPNIDSGTVFFMGLIYGGLCASIAGAERRTKESRS